MHSSLDILQSYQIAYSHNSVSSNSLRSETCIMATCGLLPRWGRFSEVNLHGPHPHAALTIPQSKQKPTRAHIDIQTKGPDGSNYCNSAVLSYDRKPGENLVSRRLVENVLHIDVRSIDKESAAFLTRKLPGENVEGFVDLQWSFEDEKQKQTTRLYVAADPDPPYDVRLGKQAAKRYGLA